MKTRGFTLVEMMVVVTVITILMSVGFFVYNEASKKSRDYDRQSDLKTVQAALDLYKQKYGRYPAGCNSAGSWSGQLSMNSSYACSNGSAHYIVGLAPEFIPTLPYDRKAVVVTDAGYVYVTNTEGSVYKIMALNAVESEVLTPESPFSRCGNTNDGNSECSQVPDSTSGSDNSYNQTGSTPNNCFGEIANDYALWGGYADGISVKAREYYSDIIRCK